MSSEGSQSDDGDDSHGTKRLRKGDGGFQQNMARKSVHRCAPPSNFNR